jgi:hypothetical protein
MCGSKKLINLLITIGLTCFNFYYGEDSPQNLRFEIIISSFAELVKNKIVSMTDSLFKELNKSFMSIKNWRDIRNTSRNSPSFIISYSYISCFISSLFHSIVLEKIVSADLLINLVDIIDEKNYEFIEHIIFLINNLEIQSSIFIKNVISRIQVYYSKIILKTENQNYTFFDQRF